VARPTRARRSGHPTEIIWNPTRSRRRHVSSHIGLVSIRLHSLRHSHGSELLLAGVPITVVSRRLGHSSVAITAAIYSHSFTRNEIATAEVWKMTMRTAVSQGGKRVARQ